MSFRQTDQAIRDMFPRWALQTKNARAIVRKGLDALPSSAATTPTTGVAGSGGQFPALIYLGEKQPEDTLAVANRQEIPALSASGYYPWPNTEARTQTNRVDLTVAEEMRLILTHHFPGNYRNYVYVVYTDEAHDEYVGEVEGNDYRLLNGAPIPAGPVGADPWTSVHLPVVNPRMRTTVTGHFHTDWFPIPENLRRDVSLHFMITGDGGDVFDIGHIELQVRWPAGGAGTLTFSMEPPGLIDIPEEGAYYMTFDVLDGNSGYTQTEARDLILEHMDATLGWNRAIVFPNPLWESGLGLDARVHFRIIADAHVGTEYSVITPDYDSLGTTLVELDQSAMDGDLSPGITPSNVVLHAAGHAFMGANHTGTGIMGSMGATRPPYPTPRETQAVLDWLGING